MLKVEKLNWEAGAREHFMSGDGIKHGVAKLTLASDVVLTGHFHTEKTASGVVAMVGVTGDVAKLTVVDPTNVKLELSCRTMFDEVVEKGEDVVLDTGELVLVDKKDDEDESKDHPEDNPQVCKKASTAKIEDKIEIDEDDNTATCTVTKDGLLVWSAMVKVASGEAEDKLAKSAKPHTEGAKSDYVVEPGFVHVEAVCRLEDVDGLKPARTEWVDKGGKIRLATIKEMETLSSEGT